MNLQMTANTETTMDLSWTCDADPAENDFTVTYQMLRPDYAQSTHPDFAQQSKAVSGATTTQLTGLHGPFEYHVEVCSDAVNTTCGCSSGRFRTAGVAVYVNSIEHYATNGTVGGKALQGAFFFDDSADCVAAHELRFANCDVTVNVYEAASDPAVRQYPGVSSNQVQIAVSSAYRRNFVTFNATFESTTDPCWGGVLDLGYNPAMDNVAVNTSVDANTDYRGAPANLQIDIDAQDLTEDDVSVERTSTIAMWMYVQPDIFDEFGNNVTNDAGEDQGFPMQNQTNFAMQGQLVNATTPLNHADVTCGWSVVISIDNTACPTIESREGNLDFTDNGDGTFSADAEVGNETFFMSGKVSAPVVLAGCAVSDLEAATGEVTLRAFN